MFGNRLLFAVITVWTAAAFGYQGPESHVIVGSYSTAMDNFHPTAPDAGVPGFVGPDGRGKCPPGPNDEVLAGETVNYVNPVFNQWATGFVNYIPAPAAEPFIGQEAYAPYRGVPPMWRLPLKALGPVTGDNFDVCVLGDLFHKYQLPGETFDRFQIPLLDPNHPGYAANAALPESDPHKIQPGQITLTFSQPIHNGPGPDFVVFENGFISDYTLPTGSVAGQIFAELAYVEVSTDGQTFVRFPSVSLTLPLDPNGLTDPSKGGTGAYGCIDPTNVYNLAGKHANAYGSSWGTPFNLKDIANASAVLNGAVDINNINYIRIVDIPGNGFFKDMATSLIDPSTIDPNTGLGGSCYTQIHGIHDAWVTWGSGGFDLEAVGAIEQIYGDADSDGDVDLFDFARIAVRWNKYGNWPQGDFDENGFVDLNDLLLLSSNWLYKASQ